MKTLFTIGLLLFSLKSFAFSQSAILDFSKLYGNTDAGVIEASVTFSPKMNVSRSDLATTSRHDDGMIFCVTSAQFDLGEMTMTLVNNKTGWTKSFTKKIIGTLSTENEGEVCNATIEDFAGKQVLYSLTGLGQAIELPVKAPFEYTSVGMYLEPFNGYLYLEADVVVDHDMLKIRPSKLLTADSITTRNQQNASVTYYVFAKNEVSTLSLGTGLVKFE